MSRSICISLILFLILLPFIIDYSKTTTTFIVFTIIMFTGLLIKPSTCKPVRCLQWQIKYHAKRTVRVMVILPNEFNVITLLPYTAIKTIKTIKYNLPRIIVPYFYFPVYQYISWVRGLNTEILMKLVYKHKNFLICKVKVDIYVTNEIIQTKLEKNTNSQVVITSLMRVDKLYVVFFYATERYLPYWYKSSATNMDLRQNVWERMIVDILITSLIQQPEVIQLS